MALELPSAALSSASQLALCVGQIAERLEAGEPIDLAELCAEFPEHREQLEMLLPTLQAVVELDASLAGSESPAATPTPEHGDELKGLLGDFRIVRELGRGGMGVVYEAEQLSIGRRVALKVLPFAAMLDKQQLNRFKNEARAAGTLDHPNIVAIYSVGVERSVHFYAMQLIEGESLAQAIARMRRERGMQNADREGDADATATHHSAAPLAPSAADTQTVAALSTIPSFDDREYYRTVARLGIQAAEALDHAHQNGILHRDVKPANLMVDEAGKLWVTDFGLARMEADAGMTMTGDLIGTLRYMSPEQALAKRVVVDHRSDIYSLGVTLYELLTLEPVFAGADRQELLRQIAFDEPAKLRQVNSQIPQDLETIVLKAMEKNPAQRYATARDLADDLRSYQAHEPIKAKPPKWVDQVVKWARRHPAGVRATAIATLATAIVLAGALGWSARDRAAREGALSQHVHLALEEAKTLFEADQVGEAISAVKRAEALLSGGGSQLLTQSVETWHNDLEMVQRLDGIRTRRGGRSSEAEQSYRDAFEQYGIDVLGISAENAATRIKTSRVSNALVAALDDWSQAGATDGTRDNADEVINKQVLSVARAADTNAWRNRLRDAVESSDEGILLKVADEPEVAEQPTSTILLLARALEARSRFDKAAELLERIRRRRPNDFFVNIELATCLRCLEPPQTTEALAFRRVAVALRPDSATAYNHLAVPLDVLGKHDEAGAAYRESIRLDPTNVLSYHNLVHLLIEQGRREEAEALFQAAPIPKPEDHGAYSAMATSLFLLGRSAEAEVAFREAIRIAPSSGVTHANFGELLAREQRFDEAIVEFREAIRVKLPDVSVVYRNLGVVLSLQGNDQEAEAAFREVLRLGTPDAVAYAGLGESLERQNKHAEAEEPLKRAVELTPVHAYRRILLAFALANLEKFEEAESQLTEAISLDSDSEIAHALLGEVLARQGDYAGAIAEYENAIALRDDNTMATNNLASLLATAPEPQLRDGARAVQLATRACELTNYESAHELGTLAEASAEVGDFESAVKWATKAVELANDEALRSELSEHLESFKSGKPWRVGPHPEDDAPGSD